MSELNLKTAIKDFADKVTLMGGICGVNVNEPSEGDLKRLNDAYIKVWSECADLKQENSRLKELVSEAIQSRCFVGDFEGEQLWITRAKQLTQCLTEKTGE